MRTNWSLRPLVRRRVNVLVLPLLVLGISVPVAAHAVVDSSRNPQATLANNFNDMHDLAHLPSSRTRIRPAISSGSDTISGQVVDASNGSPVSGATVYLSDVNPPCNNSQSAGPCAPAMQTTTTNSSGNYSLTGIGNGTYNLAVSRLTSGSTMYPQTAPGVVPTSDTSQQGVHLNLTVSGNTTANFSLQPFAAPGSRTTPSGHAKNLIVVDFDETYAKSWFNDANLSSFSQDVINFANSGANNQNGFATYGWSPVDHYSLATGQYPYWRFFDPWPNNLCNWGVSGNGGADCGIDTNMFYCSGSCVPEVWGQMSMFDVAKAYGMSTAVIGGSDYPTGHINDANVDSIQLGANSQCPSAGSSCQWETEAESWITGTGGPNANGFLLYMPVTAAEGFTPENTSPDASGSSYQNAQALDDQIFADFRSWLSSHGYLSTTDMVVVADEAENDHTNFDNFYGTNSTKNVPTVFNGPDYQSGLHPTNLIHLDDVAATALGGLCLPPPAGDRGAVQTSYYTAQCPTGNPTPTNTPVPSTSTNTPIPATSTNTPVPPTNTNTPVPPTSTNTPVPGATSTNTPVPPTHTNTPVPSTATNTPVPPTATNTSVPPSATATASGGSGIVNGGFETGSLAPWTATINQGSGNAEVAPQISSSQHHSGSYSALVGGTSTTEPSGDSCLYQDFTSSSGTYSAYYLPFDPNGDTITYDWQEGYIRAAGTSGCAESGTQLFRVESNSQTWTQTTATLAAGSHQAYFNVHEDGYGDPSYMYVDDVSAPAGGGATATNTPVPPTRTNTPPPASTSTNTPVPPTATATSSGGFSNPVVNGGFETGTISGWTSAGVGQGGQAVASTDVAHSGSYSARMGVPSGAEPTGDNCLYQNESFSGSHTLSFYDYDVDTYGDTITYDWMEAYYRPLNTSGCAETGTQLFKIEGNNTYWYHDSFTVTGPGQVYFNVHEDGSTDPSAMYIDDVQIQQ